MKPICLNLGICEGLEELLCYIPTIKKLSETYQQKITILSKMPELFKNNPFVEKSYKISSVDIGYFNDNYKMHNSFYNIGKKINMKKLLFITPHTSTGGAPQVTANKVELLKNDFEIKVVEYSCIAWNYIVQRNRIIESIGKDNFITLLDNKHQLLQIIQEFKPDVIAMEEFPEMFMDEEIATQIYSRKLFGGEHYIIETTHDSSFKVKNKLWIPDEFVFVSPYTALKYKDLKVPTSVIEYPIDKLQRDKRASREKLGLEHDYKHIVIIGLFTPRKNQKYAFFFRKNRNRLFIIRGAEVQMNIRKSQVVGSSNVY